MDAELRRLERLVAAGQAPVATLELARLRAGQAVLWDRCADLRSVLAATQGWDDSPNHRQGLRTALRELAREVAEGCWPPLIYAHLRQLQSLGWWDSLSWSALRQGPLFDCQALAWLVEEELLRLLDGTQRDPREDPLPGDRVECREVLEVRRLVVARRARDYGTASAVHVRWRGWRPDQHARSAICSLVPARRGPADPKGRPRDLEPTEHTMLASSWRAWAAGRRVHRRTAPVAI